MIKHRADGTFIGEMRLQTHLKYIFDELRAITATFGNPCPRIDYYARCSPKTLRLICKSLIRRDYMITFIEILNDPDPGSLPLILYRLRARSNRYF